MTVIDTTAAELEGLVDVNQDQLALLRRRRQLMQRRDAIEAELKQIRDELLKDIETDGLTGLMYNGKRVVNRVVVHQTKLDTARFKAEMPELAASFAVANEYVRVDVNF